MSEKRFSWKTEKLQHSDDEVIMVVDNANKEWNGHILNIVDLLNEQQSIIDEQKIAIDEMITDYKNLEKENEQLKNDNLLFFQQVFNILMKYQHLFNREMADEVLEDLGIELTEWFE